MPRKKTIQQTLGERLGVRMPPSDQANVLAAIDGFPPITYWDFDKTDDQKELFNDVRFFYQQLKTELELLFTGQGSNIPNLLERDRGAMGAILDRELAWYAVTQRGWQYIDADLVDMGFNLAEHGINSPGDALIDHLTRQCSLAMSEGCSPYYRFSPSAERKFSKLQTDIERGDRTPTKINRYNSIAKQKNTEAKSHMALSWKMMQICEKYSAKDRGLARLLKAYGVAQGNVDRECAYMLSERQKMKGIEWENGVNKPLTRG